MRRKVHGTAERPRLCVFKSLRHIYVQILDDMVSDKGSKSLLQVTTNTKEFRGSERESFGSIEQAKILGAKLCDLMKQKGITKITFDRSGYKYHGLVKALADTLREGGIKF